MATPAELLVGENIDGWSVENNLGTYPGMTGGHFSTGYIVSKGGRRAFLKAMDLHNASAKGVKEVARATQQFEFERELLGFCSNNGLSHVVRLLHNGQHHVGSQREDIPAHFYTVYYMIFEYSESGDIRREITFDGVKPASWKLHVLHQAAIGLKQLHTVNVAHQDLKPSNLLGFPEKGVYKLGDLGRSNAKHLSAPTDQLSFPGDLSYAPPEYRYDFRPSDYHDRRLGSDAYLLGSLISFLFLSVGAIMATLHFLPDEYKPDVWEGAYSEALPFLEMAHTRATQQLRPCLPNSISDELGNIYFQLCHPNPSLRGHPDARRQVGRPLGLDRYLSRFSALEKRLRVQERILANATRLES
jgi:serine/threonine protein kinase